VTTDRDLRSGPMGSDDDEPTEKEILLEIYREVRWIGRFLTVVSLLSLVALCGLALAEL